ncbi:iron complex outermembrane receptor protein [Sphingobium sp. B1D7B]|uniref:TonB-dependent receptor n=1 Tax=unclassified Sphingobium TaxID=2611147 RepID=UPI0022250F68|nr:MULTISPECIES: TonB-dependent receptor [unclassified Sphingobium]MCW2392688.1 iron complex outermembrane receptor protein [Sphingobium sp. B11D3A]MCW2404383.1 iron complex outermembrane receptor protein [Sphingobium sp. B1D7B]
MTKKGKGIVCRTSLFAMGIALSSAAGAQTPQASTSGQAESASTARDVETIMVTAQFREQNLQDTPLAITAVSGAMLEARSQTSIADVANQAPSVTLKPQGASYGSSLVGNIRGVGQQDFSAALEPGVGLYVDDVYYATLTGSILDLLDLDRVEILRGPQGTLAGKNSIGGAVKLYSRRPTGSNTGYVAATYGSRNRIDLRGSADFKLTDTISARIAGVSKKQDGYIKRLDFGCLFPAGGPTTVVNNAGATVPINPAGGIPRMTASDNCELGREGGVGYTAARGQLRFQPSSDLDINIAVDYTNEDRVNAGNVLLDRSIAGVRRSPNFTDRLPGNPRGATDINPFGGVIPYDARFVCGNYCNYATYIGAPDSSTGPQGAFANTGGVRAGTYYDGRLTYEGWGISGQIEYDLSDDLQLVSITAYRAYHSKWDADDDLSPLAHQNNTSKLRYWQFTQELRLNGSFFEDALQYTVGGFYMKQFSSILAGSDIRYTTDPAFFNNDPTDANTKAAFLHLAWKPVDRLTLSAGLRYTDEYKRYEFGRRLPDGSPLPAGSAVGALDGRVGIYDGPISTNFDYRLNAQYEITPDISIYGQVATGIKGGGINPRPFNFAQVLPFGPEKQTTYELGFKSDLFDRRVRLNAAFFFSKYSDIQLSLSNCIAIVGATLGSPCNLITNSGDADVKGFEVEASVRPVEGMMIDGAVSFVDFGYTSFRTFGTATVGGPGNPAGPQFGDYPLYTPRWKWSIGAQYEIDLGDAGSLTPRIDTSFQDEIYFGVNLPTSLIDSYVVSNARLTWSNADGDLDVSAEVTNLFDKYYLLTGFDRSSGAAGFSIAQPGRPREWAVTVKKRF